ncbi:MAG: F-type H+-transporting ATPase subunit epsilon [Limisphaerales bacterium]|jgi:F-type H+-transporting ATPase subunit epsilon
MQIDILTPEGNIYSGEGESIQLPGVDGLFEVLNNHAPLISALKEGRLRILAEGSETAFIVKGGFVEVLRNNVSVLVEGATAA